MFLKRTTVIRYINYGCVAVIDFKFSYSALLYFFKLFLDIVTFSVKNNKSCNEYRCQC